MEIIGLIITLISVAGVLLNNARRRECFLLWLFSNALSACVHGVAGMYSLAARDVIFFVLAIHGLYAWRRHESISRSLRASREPIGQ